jgi:hypothetical protein
MPFVWNYAFRSAKQCGDLARCIAAVERKANVRVCDCAVVGGSHPCFADEHAYWGARANANKHTRGLRIAHWTTYVRHVSIELEWRQPFIRCMP